ncbi:hypothetical protein AFL01nite_04780 [Aeromicrobium flavum]|uniref:Transcriptional regulator TetR C-terminal Proteobacteria type domain-containing protein n=2 Tax=Aeromicrobium flavum TaxID=416568 RepID=A0A512HRS0_9ACTN|nr:hypothetical protein AFL01nite_04780 [Aeromicrobium flavum]
MTDLFRIVIAELPRFPELAEAPVHAREDAVLRVRRYLLDETEAGTARIADPELAATQFLGMISNFPSRGGRR